MDVERRDPRGQGDRGEVLSAMWFARPHTATFLVVVADGRRWLIPAADVGGSSGLRLDGPKYERSEIEAGAPLSSAVPSLD